jgi:drug/metabolite transporter (DMT)-like permease
MGIGLVVLVGYLALSNKLSIVAGLNPGQWSWAVLTGFVLAGYVATWFAALRRAPASVVASVLVLGAVVTGALTAGSRGAAPDPQVVAGYLLIVAAAAAIAGWSMYLARRGSRSMPDGRAANAGAD